MRWQGMQEYNELVTGGADPIEALRRTGTKMFFNDPQGLVSMIRVAQQKPEEQMLQPEIIELQGERFARLGRNQLQRIPKEKEFP